MAITKHTDQFHHKLLLFHVYLSAGWIRNEFAFVVKAFPVSEAVDAFGARSREIHHTLTGIQIYKC